MRRLTLSAIFLFATITMYAQQIAHTYALELDEDPTSFFVYRDLEYDPSNEQLSLYGQKWRALTLYVSKEGKKTSFANGNKYVPFVYVAHLPAEGDPEIVDKPINLQTISHYDMSGKQYEGEDPRTKATVTSSETDVPFSELKEEYPSAFKNDVKSDKVYQMSVAPTFKGFTLIEKLIEYTSDEEYTDLVKGETRSNTAKPELDDDYLIRTDAEYLFDNRRRLYMIPTVLNQKGDKLFGFKNKRVYTLDAEGKVVNKVDVKTEYPKSLIFASNLKETSKDTLTNFEEGAILLYGRAFGVGKKNNDPDKTNYHAVVLDKDGHAIFDGSFKYGTEKRSFTPFSAFKEGENIYVFGKAVGNDEPGYSILTFNKTGLAGTQHYNFDDFKQKVSGDFDAGITSNYARRFYPISHYELSNGDLIIHGESYEEVSDQSQASNQNTAVTMLPKKNKYLSTVFVQIDKTGNLVHVYVVPKGGKKAEDEITKFKLIQDSGKKAFLIGRENNGKDSYGIIVKLDLEAMEAKKTNLSDSDVYDLRGAVVYKYFPDLEEIAYVGKSADQETSILKSVVINLK